MKNFFVRVIKNVDLSVATFDNSKEGYENIVIFSNLLNKHVQLKNQSKK